MPACTHQTVILRWLLLFLPALIAVLAAILLGTTTSAQAAGVAENRPRAFAVTGEVLVGPPQHIAAGQRRENDPDQVVDVVATGVAAKSGDEVAEVAANAPKITFGRGERHLQGTGLGVAEVESAILQRVTTAAGQATSRTGSFWWRVQIRGTTIEYRAFALPDGTINVGTYYVSE